MVDNFILISIECLRKEFLGVFNQSFRGSQSEIQRISRNMRLYRNYYCAGSWTVPSFYSMFLSRYPLKAGNRFDLHSRESSFVEILQKNGWNTIGATGGGWLTGFFGFNRGFNRFYSYDDSGKKRLSKIISSVPVMNDVLTYIHHYRNFKKNGRRIADCQNDFIKENLDDINEKLLLWVHYVETHEPYFPPSDLTDHDFNSIWKLNRKIEKDKNTRISGQLNMSDDELKLLKDLYSTEISFIDSKIGELLRILKEKGFDGENSYIFIFGDHGQQFMEHGDFGHCLELYQELINPPMMMVNQHFRKEMKNDIITSLDIGPTILKTANLKIPLSYRGYGMDLHLNSHEISRKEALSIEFLKRRDDFEIVGNKIIIDNGPIKYSLVKDGYKLIESDNGTYELYNLEDDPEELLNISRKNGKKLIEMVGSIEKIKKKTFQDPQKLNP